MHACVVIFFRLSFFCEIQKIDTINSDGRKKAHGCLAVNEYGIWIWNVNVFVCGFLYCTWHAVVQHFRGHVHYWRLSGNQVSLPIPCPAHYCSSLWIKWEKKEYDIINEMQWKRKNNNNHHHKNIVTTPTRFARIELHKYMKNLLTPE